MTWKELRDELNKITNEEALNETVEVFSEHGSGVHHPELDVSEHSISLVYY